MDISVAVILNGAVGENTQHAISVKMMRQFMRGT
jgi:hypothetical protein